MISIVCPFYNEETILKPSVENMLSNLKTLDDDWELVIVNDGSTDNSKNIAEGLAQENERLRLLSYDENQGRGFALLHGIRGSQGEMIFTTEIDSSWGDDIVHRMYEALVQDPKASMVIASPHLSGGGYKNVPYHRVLLSQFGNYIVRSGMSFAATMNTGMTRGYRREKIVKLPIFEKGKEFHLEVVLKALAFDYKIIEVPAILEWKEFKTEKPAPKRKSSSKIKKLIGSHLMFSLFAAPIRYLWMLGVAAIGLALLSGIFSLGRYFDGEPYANTLLGAIGFSILSLALFTVGVISQQNKQILQENWRLQAMLMQIQTKDD